MLTIWGPHGPCGAIFFDPWNSTFLSIPFVPIACFERENRAGGSCAFSVHSSRSVVQLPLKTPAASNRKTKSELSALFSERAVSHLRAAGRKARHDLSHALRQGLSQGLSHGLSHGSGHDVCVVAKTATRPARPKPHSCSSASSCQCEVTSSPEPVRPDARVGKTFASCCYRPRPTFTVCNGLQRWALGDSNAFASMVLRMAGASRPLRGNFFGPMVFF